MGKSQQYIFITLCFIAFLCPLNNLQARNPYHAKVIVGTEKTKFSESTFLNLIRDLRTNSIQRRIDIYTTGSPTLFSINLRGLEATASFAANSTTLTVTIPQAGISESFTGATREDSTLLLDSFLKNNRDGGKRLRKAFVKYTPIDPVAGNPNSLMALMAQSDYLLGRLSPLSGCDCSWESQPITHQFQSGIYSGRAFCNGFDSTIFTMPLRYSYSPTRTWAFIMDTPASIVINGRAVALDTSIGTGIRLPITPNWSLTSILRSGICIAVDLSTASSLVSVGATSAYNYKIKDYLLTMTNYVGYILSTPLHAGGVNWDYHLYNFAFKNGLTVTSCKEYFVLGRPLNFNLTFIDSAFTGRSLFIEHYDEIGFNMITRGVNPMACYDLLSVGLSYQFGQKGFHGYMVNIAYQF